MNEKQADAEWGQAQLQLELGFTLGLLHYIDDYQLPLHILSLISL